MAAALPYPSIVFVPLDVLTAEELNQMVQNTTALANLFPANSFLDSVYPVGSVIIRADAGNYSNFLGGTWEKFAVGKTLVGVDSTDTSFNTVGKTGGEKRHTLSEAELPEISGYWRMHSQENGTGFAGAGGSAGGTTIAGKYMNNGNSATGANSIQPSFGFGSGLSHNNLQPYITVNFWVRTA